jgi:hypothetical protein
VPDTFAIRIIEDDSCVEQVAKFFHRLDYRLVRQEWADWKYGYPDEGGHFRTRGNP